MIITTNENQVQIFVSREDLRDLLSGRTSSLKADSGTKQIVITTPSIDVRASMFREGAARF